MDLFHDTGCVCAYCELDREERAEAVQGRVMVATSATLALLLFAACAWLVL